MLDIVNVQIKVDSRQAESALKWLWSHMAQAQSGFSSFQSAMWKTYNQLTSWGRNAQLFLWSIAGLSVAKTVENVKEFSASFGLLNATIRMKMPESVNLVKKGLFDISASVWENVKSVTDSMNQLLSSGVVPKATEGTAEWKSQMQDILRIQKQVSEGSMGMWETSDRIVEAGVKFINSSWWDVNSPAAWKDAMSYMSATLDRWVWFMTSYTNQFAKFNLPAKQIWWDQSDTLSLFARFTKLTSANRAGLWTQNVVKFAERAVPEANSMRVQQKVARKILSNSAWWVNDADYKTVTALPQSTFADFFVDKNWKTRWMVDMLERINVVYSSIQSKVAKATFLTEITWGNSRVKAWLQASLEGLSDIREMSKGIRDEQERGAIATEKYAIMHDTFASAYNRFTNRINLWMTKSVDALTPAISSVLSLMSVPLWGPWQSIWDIADAFWKTRQNVMALNPSLMPVVDKMEELAMWMNSSAGAQRFSNIKDAAVGIASAIGWAVTMLWKFAANPAVAAILKFIGEHPATAVAGLFAKNLIWEMAGGSMVRALVGGSWPGSAWGMMWASLLWTLAGSTLIWVALAWVFIAAVYEWRQNTIGARYKQRESDVKYNSSALWQVNKAINSGSVWDLEAAKNIQFKWLDPSEVFSHRKALQMAWYGTVAPSAWLNLWHNMTTGLSKTAFGINTGITPDMWLWDSSKKRLKDYWDMMSGLTRPENYNWFAGFSNEQKLWMWRELSTMWWTAKDMWNMLINLTNWLPKEVNSAIKEGMKDVILNPNIYIQVAVDKNGNASYTSSSGSNWGMSTKSPYTWNVPQTMWLGWLNLAFQ
jgi:ElaB/YqjD/DUF883 family membrane-anchored ribosome-binding protein